MQNKDRFELFDARNLKGNFLPAIVKKAEALKEGEGFCVVQSFEPLPLYSLMKNMGFEHETEKKSDTEFRVYFKRIKEADSNEKKQSPFKPTAIVNFNTIDSKLANNVVQFWSYIWENENPAIDMKTRLLLSLANAVGAGRMRQAVREFVKAFAFGVTTKEFDELFAMFVWNQGVGYFASEIGPSALFGAYKLVKTFEEKEYPREEILSKLMEKFGDKNQEINTFFK